MEENSMPPNITYYIHKDSYKNTSHPVLRHFKN